MNESIKGWKHAHRDLSKMRQAKRNNALSVKLVKLTKSGVENKMPEATRYFESEDAAKSSIEQLRKLNPGKSMKYHIYVDNKLQGILGESINVDNLTIKEEIMNNQVKDLVYAISADKASDISNIFESIMCQKMITKLQEKQKEVASSMFGESKYFAQER